MCELTEMTIKNLEYSLTDLESMILEIGESDEQGPTVALLTAYMIKRGLVFYRDKSNDESPRAILSGKTSVRYHRTTKISGDRNRIILYCAKDEIDKKNISSEMGKEFFDNEKSDPTRPFGTAFEPDEFPHAVSILLKNEDNKRERKTSK